jgi:hypothetical protein
VYKHVFPIRIDDKAKPFFHVKPLDRALSHTNLPTEMKKRDVPEHPAVPKAKEVTQMPLTIKHPDQKTTVGTFRPFSL